MLCVVGRHKGHVCERPRAGNKSSGARGGLCIPHVGDTLHCGGQKLAQLLQEELGATRDQSTSGLCINGDRRQDALGSIGVQQDGWQACDIELLIHLHILSRLANNNAMRIHCST